MTDKVTTPRTHGALQLVSRATYVREWLLAALFFICAFFFVLAVGLIFIFVGVKAWPIVTDYGIFKFIGGTVWSSASNSYGILPLIAGSFLVTLGALALGTPLAVGTAVFLSDVASDRVRSFVRPAVELLAGIPSVVYGFFGIVLLRAVVAKFTGTLGFGAFTAWIVLAIMIVPTIAALSEDALRSVPEGIREASYAMGATQWQTIYKVVVPAAKIGIVDAIILGMGRAIGETMAVLMVVGNAPVFPRGIFAPLSTMTTQIVMDMPYAVGLHRTALFAIAAMLFLFSMLLVASVRLLSRMRG
ncbi:MAG: phosphate ABC transporter permease subunit PstC [Coriobacteriia bacterium]|nr:phosphate ABC transporter permease subunit PstC [Coriobacteriia bacterium]